MKSSLEVLSPYYILNGGGDYDKRLIVSGFVEYAAVLIHLNVKTVLRSKQSLSFSGQLWLGDVLFWFPYCFSLFPHV